MCKLVHPTPTFLQIHQHSMIFTTQNRGSAAKTVFLGIYLTSSWYTLRHIMSVSWIFPLTVECSSRWWSVWAAAAAAAGGWRSERPVRQRPSSSWDTPPETRSRCWAALRSPASYTRRYTHLLFEWDRRGSSSWSLERK